MLFRSGLDLIHRVPDELWNEVRDIVQETGINIFAEQAAGTDSGSKCGKVGEGRKGCPTSRIS